MFKHGKKQRIYISSLSLAIFQAVCIPRYKMISSIYKYLPKKQKAGAGSLQLSFFQERSVWGTCVLNAVLYEIVYFTTNLYCNLIYQKLNIGSLRHNKRDVGVIYICIDLYGMIQHSWINSVTTLFALKFLNSFSQRISMVFSNKNIHFEA